MISTNHDPKAPKICILTESYHPVVGDDETQLLAEGLAARRFDTMVLAQRSALAYSEFGRFSPPAVCRRSPAGGEHFKKRGPFPVTLPLLIRWRQEYDLLFVSGCRALVLWIVLLSKLLGKACILRADSLGKMSGEFFAPGLAKWGLRPTWLPFRTFLRVRNKILRRADAFVASSSAVASELVVHGVDPRLIYPIPNGVDTDRFCPATPAEKEALRQELGLPAAATLVTFAGRLLNHNGLPLLLRVWCEIVRYHEDVRLLLVGSGELDAYRCEAELREFVRFHRLEDSVLFTGSVPDMADYLRASDIFVFPVENEVFDSTLIEAMACGLPVIATAVSGIKKILQQGRSGLVVGVGNFNQLFQALEALISHPRGAHRLGQIAHQTVQQHYTAEAIIESYARLFYAVSNERSRGLAGHDSRIVFPGKRRGVN